MTISDKMRHKIDLLLGSDADGLLRNADSLHEKFKGGDRLAPFECCSLWREIGLPVSTLPNWVLEHLFKIAADYFQAGPRLTPRDLLDMPSKKRQQKLPSLDKVAGLRGTQGRRDPWSWRAEHDRDDYVSAVLKEIKRWAKEGGESSREAHQMERLARENLWDKLTGESAGESVRILDAHGRLRSEVQSDVGRAFCVGGYPGEEWDKSRTVRRRTR